MTDLANQTARRCPHCEAEFTPRNSRQVYRSAPCSAYVRNRRYYTTPSGRQKKREAQSRYFLRHRDAVYSAKRHRMEKGVQEILAAKSNEFGFRFAAQRRKRLFAGQIQQELLELEARWRWRHCHDYHPAVCADLPGGRWLWIPAEGGKLRLHCHPARLKPDLMPVYELDRRTGKVIKIGTEEKFPVDWGWAIRNAGATCEAAAKRSF